MPFLLSQNQISAIGKGELKHASHELTSELYKALLVHANGIMPEKLIDLRRPSESDHIKQYRKDIFEPITESTFTKVLSSLAKIRRSPDWAIDFPSKKNASIAEDESLEKYVNDNFPYFFTSLTNWLFSVGLKNYAIDANAVILVRPSNWQVEDKSQYVTPFPYVFNSPQVLQFKPHSHAILLAEETCCYDIVDGNGVKTGTATDGKIVYIVDEITIKTYEQVNSNKAMALTTTYTHGLGYLPAFKMPGFFYCTSGENFINKSRLAGMLPGLNEATRLYSDLQAEIVQHVHSDKWIYQNTDCANCDGTGKEQVNLHTIEKCHVCGGFGKVSTSPYSNIVISAPEMGQAAIPTPPAGYIQKTDVAMMVTKQNELCNEQLYKALAAINMQFLDMVPVAQSGVAKEVDKDELNNFVHSIAEDLVYIMDTYIRICADYRYRLVLSDAASRAELLPKIAVPAVFDLLSSTYLVDEIKTAKESKLDPLIIIALETEYAAKKFYNNPEVAQVLTLSFTLDPIPGADDDQKSLRLANDGVTQEDYIISCNITSFIKRAIREDNKFASKDYETQMEVLKKYAKDKMPAPAKSIMPPDEEEIPPVGPLNPVEKPNPQNPAE